jgi:hypothetical protein
MLKKLFVTAAAAAAVSVPLAGAAWATPANNNPPGHPEPNPISGVTPKKPGIPGVVGVVADVVGTNPNPGQALPPGQGFKGLKGDSITTDFGPVPITGGNRPERYASFIEQVLPKLGIPVGDLDKLPTGLGVKAGTPACSSGTTAAGLGLCQ